MAFFLAELLVELGCNVIANVTRVGKALELLEKERPDFMLLDVNVGGEMSYSLADALIERGIRFLFVTGYNSPSVLGRSRRRQVAPIAVAKAQIEQSPVCSTAA